MLLEDEDRLDNPVYSALTGAQSRFAIARGRVLRFEPEVAPFFGLPPDPSDADWRDAAELAPPGMPIPVMGPGRGMPGAWTQVGGFQLVQMVGEDVYGVDEPEAISLTPADVPEKLEHVRQTDPGPFLERTIELGRYLGIRREGELVAMAGERFHFDGWREISAVCTVAAHRGHGLATRLMGDLIAGMLRRAERPFLHVLATNTNAIKLYEKLGFRVRREAVINLVMPDWPG